MTLFLGVAVFIFELATFCCVGAGAALVRVRGEERGVAVETDVSLLPSRPRRLLSDSSGSSRASAVLRREPPAGAVQLYERLALQRASAASVSCTAAAAKLLLRPALFIWTLPSVCGVKVAEAAATELLLRSSPERVLSARPEVSWSKDARDGRTTDLREADLGSGVSSAACDVKDSACTDARDAPDLRAEAAPLLMRLREAVMFSGVSSAASDVSASDFDDARDGSPLGLREADGHPFAGGSWAGSSGLRM